ncbi:MAG: hypothetical protein ABIH42_06970 [Planctomycetota bacterium]
MDFSESQQNVEGTLQCSKISKLAIASCILGATTTTIVSLLFTTEIFNNMDIDCIEEFVFKMVNLLYCIAVATGIIGIIFIHGSKGKLKGYRITIVGITLGIVSSSAFWHSTVPKYNYPQKAASNLMRKIYSEVQDFHSKYHDYPQTEKINRDDKRRLLFETNNNCSSINVSRAKTYTFTFTKIDNKRWTCTADTDTNNKFLDFYIDETGFLRSEESVGIGCSATQDSMLHN